MTATTAPNTTVGKSIRVLCPTGKKAVGGGAAYNGNGYEAVSSNRLVLPDGSGWQAYADHLPFGTPQSWSLIVWAVCMNVVASP